jgi:lipoprotein NlpD
VVRAALRLAALLGWAALQTGCAGLLNWSTPAAQTHHRPAQGQRSGDHYTVQRGDTLYSIAFRNQLDYHELAAWNGIGPDYRIYPGQVLRLSAPASPQVPHPAPGGLYPSPAGTADTQAPRSASQPGAAPGAPQEPAVPAGPAPSARRWEWPTRGTVARAFDPADGAKGIDIAGDYGQIVVAAAAGKVVYSGSALKGYGELIIVKHDEDYLSAYGYNRRRLVQEGQWVAAGQPIAELGMGPQQKPLLHFEIRDKGRPVDPLALLPRR